MMETLLVPYNLDSYGLAGAMVAAVEHLSEGAFTQRIYDLVTIREVVVIDDLVVPALVVVAVVVRVVVRCRHLFVAARPDVVYRLEIEDLLALILGEVARLVALKDVYGSSQ